MKTMNPTLLKATVSIVLGLLLAHAAQGHYLWIEKSDAGATVYFGEYEESARECAPGRLDEMPGPHAQIVSEGIVKPVILQKRSDGFAFAAQAGVPHAWLIEEGAVGVKDWSKAGMGIVKPYFYARYQAPGGASSAAAPLLTLDILPQKEEGRFRVYFRGQPLPKTDVKIVAPNTWAQEGRTDADGLVQLATPWKGQYIVQVVHLEASSGEYEGKAFQAKRHRATLTFAVAGGEPTFQPTRGHCP